MRALGLALACGAAGCTAAPTGTGAPPAPVEQLIGEVHLHQFPLGSHAWAGFTDQPVAVAAIHGDQLVEIDDPIAAEEGGCALHVAPSCPAGCPLTSYCVSDGQCAPLPHVIDVDGGEVDATGSLVQPEIRLWFAGPDTGYASAPPPGAVPLFAGGERLSIADRTERFAFQVAVAATVPMAVSAPDLTLADVPLGGALAVRWQAQQAEQVVVILRSSSRAAGGGTAWIRCVTADLGALDVPGALVDALPPAPRDLRIEVERDEERLVPVARDGAPGLGVLVHVAYTTWKNWSEPTGP